MSEPFFQQYPAATRQEVVKRLQKAGRDYSGGLNEVWHLLGDQRPSYDMTRTRKPVQVSATYYVNGQELKAVGSGGSKSAARGQAALSLMMQIGIFKPAASAKVGDKAA